MNHRVDMEKLFAVKEKNLWQALLELAEISGVKTIREGILWFSAVVYDLETDFLGVKIKIRYSVYDEKDKSVSCIRVTVDGILVFSAVDTTFFRSELSESEKSRTIVLADGLSGRKIRVDDYEPGEWENVLFGAPKIKDR